ncbi:helix-turn-helix transcriptional regulator [Capillimicrobium parvum]|uniref:helix-turn-helix transcriptional regulator n=1 Tax=Capillimicrobium parvum TaxID=2884022 RepID=UPI00216B4A63|nr:YafY family protein [Capillimicrobium parvum]
MTDPTSRMLRLLTLLQTHRFWPGVELSDRLEISPRTLRRDIDRLRELGYPVDATRGAAGGYRLQAGSDLPPLLLDDDEAVAIAVGLRTAAGGSIAGIEETSVRALAKLEQVLPARLRRRVNTLKTVTVPLAFAPRETIEPETLTILAQACRDAERLQFEYRRRDGESATRAVEPHRLVSVGRRWYLVAWDVHRADWRTFRLDRLEAPRTSGARFAPRELPAEDAAAFVRQSLRSIPTRYEADVTLHVPAEAVADRVRPFGGTVEAVDDERCRMRMTGDSLPWLAAGISLLECDFELHGPPELAAWMRGLHGRIDAGVAVSPAG